MQKILFITDKYYPKPYANAVCIQNLAEEFVKGGYETHLLVFSNKNNSTPKFKNGVKVFSIVPEIRLRMLYFANDFSDLWYSRYVRGIGLLISRFNKIINWRYYPLSSKTFVRRLSKKIENLLITHEYDIIVSAFNPFESLVACMKLKQQYSKVKWVIYNIDHMPVAIKRNVTQKKVKKSCLYWQNKFYSSADQVISLKSNHKNELTEISSKFSSKILISDLPLLIESSNYHKKGFSKYLIEGKNNWVYSGSINTQHYNPKYILDFLLGYLKNKNIVFHIFGRGNMISLCEKYACKSNGSIIVHNYIPHDELLKVFEDADIFISMKNSNQISAKIFEYISTNKKIIHFSGSKEDPDSEYIKDYANGLIINTYENDIEKTEFKLNEFIKKGSEVYDSTKFSMNKPSYTMNLILQKTVLRNKK